MYKRKVKSKPAKRLTFGYKGLYIMQQIFKDVLGYEGLYQVSNLGNVKSLKNNKILSYHIVSKNHKNRIYKCKRVCLCFNGKQKKYLIHRLVYEAFNGLIPDGFQIDHIDNNPQNNKLDNLQILTRSENCKKRYIDNPNLATSYIGYLEKNNPKRKILCLNNNVIYNSLHEAGRQLNISFKHISAVCKGQRKHTKGYIFIYI